MMYNIIIYSYLELISGHRRAGSGRAPMPGGPTLPARCRAVGAPVSDSQRAPRPLRLASLVATHHFANLTGTPNSAAITCARVQPVAARSELVAADSAASPPAATRASCSSVRFRSSDSRSRSFVRADSLASLTARAPHPDRLASLAMVSAGEGLCPSPHPTPGYRMQDGSFGPGPQKPEGFWGFQGFWGLCAYGARSAPSGRCRAHLGPSIPGYLGFEGPKWA